MIKIWDKLSVYGTDVLVWMVENASLYALMTCWWKKGLERIDKEIMFEMQAKCLWYRTDRWWRVPFCNTLEDLDKFYKYLNNNQSFRFIT